MTLVSANGWKASKDKTEIGIKSFQVPGTSLKLQCAEACAPLLIGFTSKFHKLIEPVDGATLDDWGYCFRDVRGVTGKLSNHSSGTAIDLNATKHPLGKIGTFPNEKVPMIRALAKKYGLIWGGDYKSRKDEMHFEIALPPAKVAALIAKLEKENEGIQGSRS